MKNGGEGDCLFSTGSSQMRFLDHRYGASFKNDMNT